MNLITNASDALEGQPGLVTVKIGTIRADRQMLSATYLKRICPRESTCSSR
jgi:hypothetical protein